MAAAHSAIHQPTEAAEIQDLYRLFMLERTPALVGPDHKAIPIPESIYNILLQVIGYMRQGKAVSVVPVMQELTTQEAAHLLGVSRPFLVNLLEKGKVPFHKTGTHRRVYLKDVMHYREKRDAERRATINEMARVAMAEGNYDEIPVPTHESSE